MTPKEKARELVDKFSTVGLQQRNEGITCSLIAVDEILEAQPSRRYWDTYDDETPSSLIYWQEVKQEIEKL